MEKEAFYYYLGPEWMPEKYRKRLPFSVEFVVAARSHDIGYERGKTFRDKWRADVLFLRLCLVASSKINGLRMYCAYAVSVLYFIAVSLGGFVSFYK